MSSIMSGMADCSFLRARSLLQKGSGLTQTDSDELELLFEEMSASEYIALAQDPRHAGALRAHDRYQRTPGRSIVFAMLILFGFCASVGLYLVS